MKNFNYKLNYKKLNFRKPEIRKLYRIGRGEQGVLLVRPYTNIICRNWRFKTPQIAEKSANTIYHMYRGFRALKDFVGMDMCRKFLQGQEDMRITKTVRNTKMVKYYRKKKIGQRVKKQSQRQSLKNIEIWLPQINSI